MVGMRVYECVKKPKAELVKMLEGVAAANACDCMGRLYSMDSGIHTIGKGKTICGTALTVKAAIADNMLFHQALLMAEPGDVVVVNAGGDLTHSVCGDIMYRIAQTKGVLGFVVDGCVRDIDWLLETDSFTVYARGAVPGGPYKTGPGEVNCDVSCGGQVVHPGDVILGDADGVIVIPQDDLETVIEKVKILKENEMHSSELIASGRWEESGVVKGVKRALEEGGYTFNK